LSMTFTELGQVTLECQSSVHGPGLGVGHMDVLATGRSPSSAKPDNREAYKALETDPMYRRQISLSPKPCQKVDFMTAYGLDFSKGRHIDDDLQAGTMVVDAHVNSADVWEALHSQTGLPIVSDYYTHIYPSAGFIMEKVSILDAVHKAADQLG